MKHIDLFSGIGGFALAARNIWGPAYENMFFCEMNRYCQEVLKKNFGKEITIYDDIRRVTTDSQSIRGQGISGRGRKQEEERNKSIDREYAIDLLTGGFPCQPFSQAGKRKGTDDDRYLWPEMLRVIKEFKPTWIIGENVAGILSMAQYESDAEMASETDLFGNKTISGSRTGRGILHGIVEELGEIGYEVQVFIIPAVAVNAPHRRDRIWIVANSECGRSGGERRVQRHREIKGKMQKTSASFITDNSNASNTEKTEFKQSGETRTGRNGFTNQDTGDERYCNNCKEWYPESSWKWEENGECPDCGFPADPKQPRRTHRISGPEQEVRTGKCGNEGAKCYGWERNWLEVATELCGVDDGLLVELDGFKLTKAGHRVERLKALGNAIVPQVAEQIMRAIKESEKITVT